MLRWLWLIAGVIILFNQGCSMLAIVATDKKLLEAEVTTDEPFGAIPFRGLNSTNREVALDQGARSLGLPSLKSTAVSPLDRKVAALDLQENLDGSAGDEYRMKESSNVDFKSARINQDKQSFEPASKSKIKNGRTEKYKVKNGDTLMKISFEKYGTLYRWREIFNSNREKIKNYNLIYPGMVLKVEGVEYLVISKNGSPYLIKANDTLKTIARKLYGDSNRWQDLWKNNPELIRNPKQIFAGFHLYYKPNEKQR